jgi:2-oxoisovalerate dehydrogenase E1 component
MILGMAGGAAHLGMLPIPEIQYLAYYHNAEDQIRGEACSLQFFSKAQFRSPMMLRMQGWGYQKGFGGHFHNDNSIAALRDVPGLIVATSARGDDTVRIMRTLMAMAKVDGRVSILIDPIALYMTKDLHENKDGLWQFPYPAPGDAIDFLEGHCYHEDGGNDLTIITFANGLYMSLRAAKELKEKRGINARVLDLRWLQPLNESFIEQHARATGRVLVVDESRRAGGVAESILSVITERCPEVRAHRLNALDTYIPLGPAANLVIPTEEDIVREAERVVRG